MRKVELRMNELEKYKTIKKLVEENGNKKRAAIKLQCTVRTVDRLIQKYNEFGKEAFVHGNRGRKPSTTKKFLKKPKNSLSVYTRMTTLMRIISSFVKFFLKITIFPFLQPPLIIGFVRKTFFLPKLNVIQRKL